jgi:uncharacterized protein (TIGR04141 family)
MATETLSVYLLKPHVTRPADALKEALDGGVERFDVAAGDTVGQLLLRTAVDAEPNWVRLLAPFATPTLDATGRSLSAVLFVPSEQRWFAVTFGHGRTLLDPRSYERDFGLRAALNAVDPQKLRGLEARTFNEHALHTQRQLSRLAGMEMLELDSERNVLTSLSGQLASEVVGKRMDGRDAARITVEIDVADIAAKCGELFDLSRQAVYKQHFPEADRIVPVRDPADVERLDERALAALGRREFDRFDVFPPELVDSEVVGFQLLPGARRMLEPDEGLLRHPIPEPMSAAEVRSSIEAFQLEALDATGVAVDAWPLWDCLHHQLRDGSEVFVLDRGTWYCIERKLVDAVEREVAAIPNSPIRWPRARSDETEPSYNPRAAALMGFALLDRNTIRLDGQTPIEPCDLLTPDYRFVHVKPRKGGSGSLSHLFVQALGSAESFVLEHAFRAELRAKLAALGSQFASFVPDDPVDVGDYTVVLALIARASAVSPAVELPFLSKLALRRTARELRKMGLTVYVDRIEQDVGPTAARPPPRRRGRRRRPVL